jgi:prophage regulatory protein
MVEKRIGDIVGSSGPRFIRRRVVENITGLGCSTIYEYMAEGRFPKPVKLSKFSVAWIEQEVRDWMADRIAERDGSQLEA